MMAWGGMEHCGCWWGCVGCGGSACGGTTLRGRHGALLVTRRARFEEGAQSCPRVLPRCTVCERHQVASNHSLCTVCLTGLTTVSGSDDTAPLPAAKRLAQQHPGPRQTSAKHNFGHYPRTFRQIPRATWPTLASPSQLCCLAGFQLWRSALPLKSSYLVVGLPGRASTLVVGLLGRATKQPFGARGGLACFKFGGRVRRQAFKFGFGGGPDEASNLVVRLSGWTA